MFFILIMALSTSLTTASGGGHVKKESMIFRPEFNKLKRSSSDVSHEVVIALHQNNLDKLEEIVIQRSTPGHALYQKWLNFDEVGNMIKNPIASEQTISWLKENSVDISWKSQRGEYIRAIAPIHVWERMLQTEFYEWEDRLSDSKRTLHLAEDYSVPSHLSEHIEVIFNTVQVPPIISSDTAKYIKRKGMFKSDIVLRSPSGMNGLRAGIQSSSTVTVAYLNSFYKINSNLGEANLSQSVFETSNQYFSQNDLKSFQQEYDLTVQAAEDIGGFYTTSATGPCSTDGGTPDCNEGNLDLQYIMGIAQRVTTIYWYVPSSNPFVTWITDVADTSDPPQSNSISWGSIEQYNSASTKKSFNTEAMKLAAVGVTIAVSSGDDGVANFGCPCDSTKSVSYANCACDADSSSSVGYTSWTGSPWTGKGYFPSFPASCPYVTAVGGTMASGGYAPSVGGTEIACQSQLNGIITTGGGFSTYYAQPSWQTAAVSSYFENLPAASTPVAGYNRNGRGYPDVSFVAVRYQVMIANSLAALYGTSASAPVFAAFVSLVNSERLLAGLPSIGFLNPTLYSSNFTSYYNDVSSGVNSCCSYPDQSICCDAGFTATSGWDPVTGWGSIDFDRFAQLFNTSIPYVVTVTDDSPTPAIASKLVAILVVVLVVAAILASGIAIFWCTCCSNRTSRQSQQNQQQAFSSAAYPIPQTSTVQVNGQGGEGGFWECPRCTLHNHNTARHCTACNSPRQRI